MNGWAKFFLLIACCVITLILWPQYNREGLHFMMMLALLWTCLIMLVSVVGNIFALYKFETLNRLISIIYLIVMLASLIYYFPLQDGKTPYLRMKNNIWPTIADTKEGVKRLTFNFDFVHRNVRRDANFVNQKLEDTSAATKKIQKKVEKAQDALDIIVEPIEEETEE